MQQHVRLDPDLFFALAAIVVVLLLGTGIVRLMHVQLSPWAWAGIGMVVVLLVIAQAVILLATRNIES